MQSTRISEGNIQNMVTSQKASQWTIPTSRTEKEQSCNCSQDISESPVAHQF